MGHTAAYVIVNAFLVFVDLYAWPHYLWFLWPLAGWGIGLTFHIIFSRKSYVLADLKKKEAMAELLAREKRPP